MNFLIVDDHSIVRLGLENALKTFYPFCKTDFAINDVEVLKKVKENNYDLVILDANIPNTDTLLLTYRLTHEEPKQKVVLLSMSPEKVYKPLYISKGAVDFLEKSRSDEDILKAIQKILANNYNTPQNEENDCIHNEDTLSPFSKLTTKETEVMLYLLKGKSVGEISKEIHLHTSTIGTHKKSIFDKLNIKNNVELTELAKAYEII